MAGYSAISDHGLIGDSNLGSSLGTAAAGTILVSNIGKTSYAAAMIALALVGIIGLGAAALLPHEH